MNLENESLVRYLILRGEPSNCVNVNNIISVTLNEKGNIRILKMPHTILHQRNEIKVVVIAVVLVVVVVVVFVLVVVSFVAVVVVAPVTETSFKVWSK